LEKLPAQVGKVPEEDYYDTALVGVS